MSDLRDIRIAQQIVEASRPHENSGPVNRLLLEQVCNITDAALERLGQLIEENEALCQQIDRQRDWMDSFSD